MSYDLGAFGGETSDSASAWHGFLGWFAVLCAVAAAGILAAHLLGVAMPVPVRLAVLGPLRSSRSCAPSSRCSSTPASSCEDVLGAFGGEDVCKGFDEGRGFGYWLALLSTIAGHCPLWRQCGAVLRPDAISLPRLPAGDSNIAAVRSITHAANAQSLLPRKARGRSSPEEVETAMRAYEVMVILDPSLDERTIEPSLDKYLNVIRKDGGSIESLDVWGRRRMAYEIKKNAEGIYAVISLTAEPATVKEFDRQLTLNESILRTKVMRPDAH